MSLRHHKPTVNYIVIILDTFSVVQEPDDLPGLTQSSTSFSYSGSVTSSLSGFELDNIKVMSGVASRVSYVVTTTDDSSIVSKLTI